MSAIGNSIIKNRLSQTITVTESTYSIGNVYLYFYGPYGDMAGITVNIRLATCDNLGKPLTIVTTKTLSGTDITAEGWYSIDMDITGNTPSNQFLSIVVWQTGGDEDNFVAWGYGATTISGTSAWLSNDGITWEEQDNIVRALKLVSSFDAYDLDNFKLLTPPASLKGITQTLDKNIEIEYPKYMASIVVDSSGSMGWNDRFNTRKDLATKLINKLQDNYNSDVLIDVINIGSRQVEFDSIYSNIGMASTINLDLNVPTKTTYVLAVSSVSAEKDAIYSHNDALYTVSRSLTSGTSLVCLSNTAPLASGKMVKQSGVGDETISFASFTTVSIGNNTIVAHGFKNLEDGHEYILGDVDLDNNLLDTASSTSNWQTFLENGGNLVLTEGEEGPQDASSIRFTANDNVIIRKPFSSRPLFVTNIVNAVEEGGSTVVVDSTSDFTADDTIVLVDYDMWSNQYAITSIDSSSELTISPVSTRGVQKWSEGSGIVQISNIKSSISIDGTTMMLLVKDVNATRNIIYYLETSEGYIIEWEFRPFTDWVINALYWLGRTALFPISVFDVNGNPFPDGTKIEFFVDKVPEEEQAAEIETQFLTADASIGDNTVYLVSTVGYAREDEIDILDANGNIQHSTITEVGDLASNPYIKVSPLLRFAFTVANGSRIVATGTVGEAERHITESNRLPSTVGMVDITPMYIGTQLDSSLLRPYDPPQIDPSTNYDDLNLSREYIRMNIQDIPTNNGYAVIRVLPITEDNLKTIQEKELEKSRLLRYESNDAFRTISDQLEQNSGDIAQVEEGQLSVLFTTTTTTLIDPNADYTINTPVFLLGGYAEGSMKSFATDLTEVAYGGLNIAGTSKESVSTSSDVYGQNILVKSYNIYPTLTMQNFSGSVVAKQFFEPFDVDFTPPINIFSEFNGDDIGYLCQADSNSNCPARSGYSNKSAPGVYASSGDSFTIDYIVTDENVLIKDGTLNIKIYSNPSANLEEIACYLSDFKRVDLNRSYPPTITVVGGESVNTQELSEIDQWRSAVESNPYSQIIKEKQTANTEESVSALNEAKQVLINAGLLNSYTPTSSAFEWYTDPTEWIMAEQYAEVVYNQTINIVNGKATLVVPASDVSALLMIQASVVFGDNDRLETIASDLVFSANPLNVGAISPIRINAVGGTTLYELSTNVTWEGAPIADDVVVNVNPPSTRMTPAVAKTSDGRAAGLFIGPHAPVVMSECVDTGEIYGVYEDIEINVSYLGYELTVSRYVEWVGGLKGEDDPTIKAFEINSSGSNFSDGSMYGQRFYSNLNTDPLNLLWLGTDGIDALKGDGQQGGLPRVVSYGGYGFPDRVRFLTDGTAETYISDLNQNIGYQQVSDSESNAPWRIETRPTTSYKNVNGEHLSVYGVRSSPYFLPPSGTNGVEGRWVFPGPLAAYTEPLKIELSLESYGLDEFGRPIAGVVKRDGVQSVPVVASIKWKNAPINGWYVENEGQVDETLRWVGFPDVQFIGGTCLEENIEPSPIGSEKPATMKDVRNSIGGCLLVGSHPDVILSGGTVTTSLSRTDIYEDKSTALWIPDIIVDGEIITPGHWEMVATSIHYHNITIDTDGIGTTSDTVVLYGNIASHTHTIVDYEGSSSGTPAHTHESDCVAIVNLEPFDNKKVSIAINGYVRFDPTSCKRLEVGKVLPDSFAYPDKENRMMFATVRSTPFITGEPRASRGFVFEIDVNNKFVTDSSSSSSSEGSETPSTPTSSVFTAYTAETVTDTSRGFDIRVKAIYTGYYEESPPGTFTWIPATPVPNGSRVTFDIKLYKPLETNTEKQQGSVIIMDPNTIRKYMVVDVGASIYSEGYKGIASTVIDINSYLQWLPSVEGLVPEPTNDVVYLATATGQIATIGSSQIHDGVKLAADRLIQYQTDNPAWKDSKKTIYLLTDGDENASAYAITQSIGTVNFIDGKNESPVIAIKFGNALSSDDILMKEYAYGTGGQTLSLVDSTNAELDDILDDIVTSGTTGINERVYSGSFDLNKNNIISEISLNGVTVPVDGRVQFRIRYSSDNFTWSSWSSWQNSSGNIDLEIEMASRGRYLQYEIRLLGNQDFQSPVITEGPTVEYYDSQNFITFFQPVELDINTDEYLASIHITHQASIPHTSVVTYGYTQFNSVDPLDYSSIVRPEITPDRHTIMPTRFNERFLTEDHKIYTAINGGWAKGAEIEVYAINITTLSYLAISPSEYVVNHIDGTITFYTTQDENNVFVLSVYFDSSFRILCNVTNYGPSTASVDYIGLLYNIAKRIPADNNGNITHIPIDKRIL